MAICFPIPCACGGAVAVFDYNAWVSLFPEFANIDSGLAQQYFDVGTQFLRNDGTGPVSTPEEQLRLLNLVTAHIAQLFAPQNNGQPDSAGIPQTSSLVGRVSHVVEGDVSVTAEANFAPGNAQWWNSTRYGALFWAATTAYRLFRYIPGPRPIFDFPFRGY